MDTRIVKKDPKTIFNFYNRVADLKPCPDDRIEISNLLDAYARAAANLYGVITPGKLVKIFNRQNEESLTAEEGRDLLLPKVLDGGMPRYAFYKDHLVHHRLLDNFDAVDTLVREQSHIRRFPTRWNF